MRLIISLALGLILSICLYASSTHNQSVLKHYIIEQEIASAYAGLWPSAKRGSDEALLALVKLAEVNADIYWLEQAATLNSLEAQLALVQLSESAQDKRAWQLKAAGNEHGPSQFDLYLSEDDSALRLDYLLSAANNAYQPAIIAYGKYLYEQGDTQSALIWLNKAAEFDPKSRYMLARVQWQLGDNKSALDSFALAGETFELAKTYAKVIQSNRRLGLQSLVKRQSSSGEASFSQLEEVCSQQLQFVALSLDSAVQATKFAKQFAQDERFTDFPICINPIVWLEPKQLSCRLENNRQRCDFTALAKETFMPNFTHLVLFLGAGTAYVQHGVMYLDEADTYSVFVHEMAHFAGFVDEYAVAPELAEDYCISSSPPNLLVLKNDQHDVYQDPKFSLWQSYMASPDYQLDGLAQQTTLNVANQATQDLVAPTASPPQDPISLQLGRTRTCLRLDMDAYKPSSDITFLEHHDTNNIPDIYLRMWQDQLQQQHHQYEIARGLYRTAHEIEAFEAAEHWANLLK